MTGAPERSRRAAARIAAGLVVALCLSSTASSLFRQASDLLEPVPPPRSTHPEVPGEDQGRLLDILESCQRHVHENDFLGIILTNAGGVQVFLHYRLAYLLYPVPVAAEYVSAGAETQAFDRLRRYHPSLLLVLGAPDAALPGTEVLSRPAPDATLLRVLTAGRP